MPLPTVCGDVTGAEYGAALSRQAAAAATYSLMPNSTEKATGFILKAS